MKKHLLVVSALSLCFCVSKAQLTYTKITSGLNTVFEGGNSQFSVGDVDGDGDLDIVSIGDHGSPSINGTTEGGVMVWKNDGTGTNWTYSHSGNFGYGGVALGDVNNDGKLDVGFGLHHNATSGFGGKFVNVGIGDGTGTNWTAWDNNLSKELITDPNDPNMAWGMFGSDFGDVNNDGFLDLASMAFGGGDGLWLYKNEGNGSWTALAAKGPGNVLNDMEVHFGDFNNDGNLDLSVSAQTCAYKGDGLGHLTAMQTGITPDWTMKSAIGDVNNDGAKDIAVISPGSGNGGQVMVYTFSKTSNVWQSISTGLPPSSKAIYGVQLDDMDMDGKCDLVAWTISQIEIYKGDGAGNWTLNGTIPNSIGSLYGYRGGATGDFDHDGYTDIVSFCSGGGSNMLAVFLHTAATPSLNILSQFPKGYECFANGSVQTVKWLSSVPAGPKATVTIDFSSAGSGGPWTNVATNVPNSGVYQWVTPNVSSPNCHLKFTITQGTNTQVVTTNAFGIGSCVTIGVNELNGVMSGFDIFPNPVSDMGYVEFDLKNASPVEINIIDMLGRNIRTVAKEEMNAGIHRISLPVSQLNAGIYSCEVRSGQVSLQQKLVVTK